MGEIEDDNPETELKKVHDARLFSYYEINAKVGSGFLVSASYWPN
ncbi:MAG: hypothetical protein ACI9YU_000111 [Flavobacteriales bacterium]|jgi:hypothetical protein